MMQAGGKLLGMDTGYWILLVNKQNVSIIVKCCPFQWIALHLISQVFFVVVVEVIPRFIAIEAMHQFGISSASVPHRDLLEWLQTAAETIANVSSSSWDGILARLWL